MLTEQGEVRHSGLVLPNSAQPTLKTMYRDRGPTEIDIRGSGFIADIYNRSSYKNNQYDLVEKGKLLVAKANLWTPEVAETRFNAIMELVDPSNTSWIGFRRKGSKPDEYVGFTWQTQIDIPIRRGSMRFIWMILRALEPEVQGRHLGRIGMQLSLISHPDATDIGHRSGSAAAILSWLMAGIYRSGTRAPYDTPFNKVPKYSIALPIIYELTHVNGQPPDPLTGVSIGEFTEPNRAYVPNPEHVKTMGVLAWMQRPVVEKGLGMDLPRGDALFEFGELK